jgi:hypothetical protein
MKCPRKPKDLKLDSKYSYITTIQTSQGVGVTASLGKDDGKAIIKLIYWLMRYRIWHCRDVK